EGFHKHLKDHWNREQKYGPAGAARSKIGFLAREGQPEILKEFFKKRPIRKCHWIGIMYGQKGERSAVPKGLWSQFWLQAKGDIRGVHNSYNFIMVKICTFFGKNKTSKKKNNRSDPKKKIWDTKSSPRLPLARGNSQGP